jgi:N-acetylglutamate synthase-like GNAT family acetyltransferase
MAVPRLRATPLAAFERDGLEAALRNSGLPTDDLDQAGHLFWRFETPNDVPVGFGGLEVHGRDALLRSVVTLPPLRRRGFGKAIIATIEQEAGFRGCRAIYLLTVSDADFFGRLGYAACPRAEAPDAIRSTAQFASLCSASAAAMVKRMM